MSLLNLGFTALSNVNGKGHQMPADSFNGTMPALPASILDAAIPGFSAVSTFIFDSSGFDISVIVTFVAVCYGLKKTYSWLWGNLCHYVEDYCAVSVVVDSNDELFEVILKWMADKKPSRSVKRLNAISRVGSASEEDTDEKDHAAAAVNSDGQFNWGKWQGRIPPRYEPSQGDYRFWHCGSYFMLSRRAKPGSSAIRWQGDEDEETIHLRCYGWSHEPIKHLIQEINMWNVSRKDDMTSTRHAEMSKSRGGLRWSWTHLRPSRPISTVILDDSQKGMITKDMNSFLHPTSPKWYATRGIPYRRGYLFHGPPGTGKTSLSFALAGLFGLCLYSFSLNDPEMTESDLRHLFSELPRRCIVLLEDIDSAGLKRPDQADKRKKSSESSQGTVKDSAKDSDNVTNDMYSTKAIIDGDSVKATTDDSPRSRQDSGTEVDHKLANEISISNDKDEPEKKSDKLTAAKPKEKPAETSWTLDDLARAFMNASKQTPDSDGDEDDSDDEPSAAKSKKKKKGPEKSQKPKTTNGISLSGLLNALDGVSSHEGRVLIMTTNHVDDLDEALIRTGRVDMRVHFDYASTLQVKELFMRMYAVEAEDAESGPWKMQDLDLFCDMKEKPTREAVMDIFTRTAEEFASRVPDRKFSPSDVQGYLLLHKHTPALACKEAEKWVENELKKQEEKKQKSTSKT